MTIDELMRRPSENAACGGSSAKGACRPLRRRRPLRFTFMLLSGLALLVAAVIPQGWIGRQSATLFANADQAAGDAEGEVEGKDDDYFEFAEDTNFDEVSIMPVSCVNYHNGHMIKFQFFETANSYKCHFKNLGTFIVSIAHYMRAYFNYQSLLHGNDFSLPGDVGFLNCVMLKETAYSEQKLYAKIGCQHRDTFTSTKLQLIVYTDAQCSQPWYDDDDEKRHDGYDINGYFLSNKVSFRPPFYSCQSCTPESISDKFTKKYSPWYDDEYISKEGRKRTYDQDDGNMGDDASVNYNVSYYNANDDIARDDVLDDYYDDYDDQYDDQDDQDDQYDDYYNNDDAGNYNHYVNQDDGVVYNYKQHDDAFYAMADDFNRGLRRQLVAKDASQSITAKALFQEYEADFRQEMSLIHRQLDQAEQEVDDLADVGDWNMCERVYHYGMWCDEDCRSLDTFRVDEWSRSDGFLLTIMCVFMSAMMLLIFAKRVKAYERASMWGDEPGAPNPGLPPTALLMLFAVVFTVIVVLAVLKFVNETLVFAVLTCILLFIFMLKLTLFESRKPQFLPARSTRNHSLKEPFY